MAAVQQRVGLRSFSVRGDASASLLAAILLAAASIWILFIARNSSFWSDDYAFVVFRQGHAPHVFLGSFNGHFALFPTLAYKVLMALFGLQHYWPYRVVLLVVHLVAVVLIFVYVRRRVGPWPALAAAALLVIYGQASELYTYPVNVGFQLAIAMGVGALLLLDAPTRRGMIWACVLLCVGVASSTLALPFLLAVIIEVARRPDRRRRLWWVPVVPLALYLLWSLKYGNGQFVWKNAGIAWGYTMDGIGRSTGGLLALSEDWGRAVAGVTLAAAVWRATRVDRLTALVAALLGFWVLTAMARAQLGIGGAERFEYPGAVLMVLVWAEAARGVRIPVRLGVAGGVVVLGALVSNAFISYGQVKTVSDIGQTSSGGMRALALQGVGAAGAITPPFPYYGANAAQLAATMKRFGVPGGSPSTLATASPAARSGADTMLRAIAPVAGAPGPVARGGPPPPMLGESGGRAWVQGGCRTLQPTGPGAALEVRMPPRGLIVRAPGSAAVTVTSRRFAGYGNADATVPAGGALQLHLTAAPGTPPWNARLTGDGPLEACAPS